MNFLQLNIQFELQKIDAKHQYSEEEFSKICNDLIKDGLTKFDENCTHAEIGQKFRQDLKVGLQNSSKKHKEVNTEKIRRARQVR